MLIAKQAGIEYHFWVVSMTRPGIEPRSPGPLANTKQISSNSFKNEITNKSFMYINLNVNKQMTDVKLLLLHNNTWNHLTVCKQMINCK